jgi:hypothetical protein
MARLLLVRAWISPSGHSQQTKLRIALKAFSEHRIATDKKKPPGGGLYVPLCYLVNALHAIFHSASVLHPPAVYEAM